MAWSDGFAHGALAASCDGCAGQCQVLSFGGGGYGCSNGANGGLGTALKGYRPPYVNNPYGNNPDPYDPEAPEPTLEPFPTAPPPNGEPIGPEDLDLELELDGGGELAPQPPSETGLPLEVWRHHMQPEAPRAAEAYHAPVF